MSHNKNTICILTSGKGTRMGPLGQKLAKALHPINGKAIISHIIDRFPADSSYVISLGFLGYQVRSYLSMAHSGLDFTFVEVDNFDGEGSGPGYSLLCCDEHLQRPFYFVSCDTLWTNEIDWNDKDNWLGVSAISEVESIKYCNLKLKDNTVVDIADKVRVSPESYGAFVGLCHIYDFGVFWNALQEETLVDGEHQISNGLRGLLKAKNVRSMHVDWMDVGDEAKYKLALSQYENYDFSKTDESLYIVNNKVIKFFYDNEIASRRVKKALLNSKVFPNIDSHSDQFYSYSFLDGDTLYKKNNNRIFRDLLSWLSSLVWLSYPVEQKVMEDACNSFYKKKTMQRLSLLDEKYPNLNEQIPVNGTILPTLSVIVELIPWEKLSKGVPVFMHGDLQFDNILYNEKTDDFKLLDWRQDFAGHVEFGDIYYDLAKLYGGIILNYDLIKLNFFDYHENDEEIYFDFVQRYQTTTYINILENFITSNGYDLDKVKTLVGIIYLNMSPLHHAPFDKLLFHLGKSVLAKELSIDKQ